MFKNYFQIKKNLNFFKFNCFTILTKKFIFKNLYILKKNKFCNKFLKINLKNNLFFLGFNNYKELLKILNINEVFLFKIEHIIISFFSIFIYFSYIILIVLLKINLLKLNLIILKNGYNKSSIKKV